MGGSRKWLRFSQFPGSLSALAVFVVVSFARSGAGRYDDIFAVLAHWASLCRPCRCVPTGKVAHSYGSSVLLAPLPHPKWRPRMLAWVRRAGRPTSATSRKGGRPHPTVCGKRRCVSEAVPTITPHSFLKVLDFTIIPVWKSTCKGDGRTPWKSRRIHLWITKL